jgi:hypothetical protein
MSPFLFALAAIAPAGSEAGPAEPIVFPSAEAAFETGVKACEGLYAGAFRTERSAPDGLGPFSRRGFYMSGSGDEARVNMLMLSSVAHVYKATVSGGADVAYVVLTQSLTTCRVGSFGTAESHGRALAYLTDVKSGWVAKPTKSPSPSAKMQLFQKTLGSTVGTLNISWPSGSGKGPNGLTAMATLTIQ